MEDYRLDQSGQEVQNILDGAAMQSDLTAENDRAELAEQGLQGNIDIEERDRKAADVTLQGNIDAEEVRAKAAEKQNADDIDALEEKIPSGASSSNKLATAGDISSLDAAIESILLLIPSAATSLNKLTDKSYVDSSIATATATFRGTYNLVNDLSLTISATHAQIATALGGAVSDEDNNDYAFVQIPTSDATPTQIAKTERYKFNGTAWEYEYDLNNSGYTAAQWAAINSGITEALVTKLSALPTNADLTTALGVLTEGIAAINAKIPSAASSSNKMVDTAAMQSYITHVLDTIDATFNVTSTDGHVTVQITQVNGVITSVNVTTSDIASAADLSLLAGRVTTAEGNISTNAQDIAALQAAYTGLTQSDCIVVAPTDTWPVSNPSQNIIYRVVDRVNTPPQYYSDYMWNGTTMVQMAQYNNAIDPRPKKGSQNLVTSGGVFDNMGALDVSELNATENPHTLATYVDLSAAIETIPSDYQNGGMSIKFVQSSDNKYVQYRYMGNSTAVADFTNVTNWQGVDDEPTDGSDNLVKSGGVKTELNQLGQPLLLSGKNIYYGIISIKTNVVLTSLALKLYYNRNVGSGYSQVLRFEFITENGVSGYWQYTSSEGTIRTGIETLQMLDSEGDMNLTIDWQNINSELDLPINLNAVDFSLEKQIPAAIESAQDGENVSLQLKNADNQNIGSPATFSTAPKNAIFYSPIAGVSFGNKTGDVYFKNVLKYIYIVSYFDDVLQAEYGEVLSTLHVGLLRNRTSDNSFIFQIMDSDNSIVFNIATTKRTGEYIIANNGYSKYRRFLYCYLGFDFTGHTEDVNYAPELSTIDTTFSFNKLNRLPITQEVTLYNQVEKISNSLIGKTVVCFGDSLTEFKDDTNELRYSDYLQMITGAKVINIGVGGTQIRQRTSPVTTPTTNEEAYAALDIVNMVKAVCEDDYSKQVAAAEFLYNGGSGDDNRAIIDELQRIDWENVDIITIFAGTNDWALGGSMIGTPDSIDINYTLGAVNYIIQSLLTTYKHLQILWFTPTVRWASAIADRNDSNWCDVLTNSGDKTLKDFVDGITDTVKKNHLEICDLYRIGWNKYNFSQYFTDTDGVHPKKGFYNIGCRFASFISSHCIV